MQDSVTHRCRLAFSILCISISVLGLPTSGAPSPGGSATAARAATATAPGTLERVSSCNRCPAFWGPHRPTCIIAPHPNAVDNYLITCSDSLLCSIDSYFVGPSEEIAARLPTLNLESEACYLKHNPFMVFEDFDFVDLPLPAEAFMIQPKMSPDLKYKDLTGREGQSQAFCTLNRTTYLDLAYRASGDGSRNFDLPSSCSPSYCVCNLTIWVTEALNISRLEEGTFDSFPNLKRLELVTNNIHDIDERVFAPLAVLEVLDLSYNILTVLPDGVFQSLSLLRVLNVSANYLDSAFFEVLRPLTKLEILVLNDNEITEICGRCFETLTSLRELDLAQNKIGALGDGTRFLTALQNLNLAYNGVSEISQTDLHPMGQLRELNLTQNGIRSIADGAFDKNLLLTKMDAAHNVLKAVPDVSSLSALQHLDLGGNQIERVTCEDSGAICNRTDVAYLAIGVDQLTFHGCSDLFDCHEPLAELHFTNNGARDMRPFRDANIQWLDLRGNLLQHLSFGDVSPHVIRLDVGNNKIWSWFGDANDVRGKQIRELSVNSNLLSELTDVHLPPTLTSLDLSNNELVSFSVANLAEILHLRVVNLESNQLRYVHHLLYPEGPVRPLFRLRDNPIMCSCEIRRLREIDNRFISTFGESQLQCPEGGEYRQTLVERNKRQLSTERSEHRPSIERSEHRSSTEISEHRPSTDRSEHQPSTDRSEHRPSTDRSEHRPSTDRSEHRPSTERSENRPSTERSEHRPSTERSERRPSTERSERRPSTERSEHRPSTERSEHRPSTEKSEHRPSTEKSEHRPSTERSEHRPSTERSKHRPSTERSENLPSTERSERRPSTESERRPSTERSEHRPSTERRERRPSTERSEHRPPTERSEHRPSTERSEHRPSTERSEHRPSTERSEHRPSTERSEHRPSTERSEHRPSTERSEHRPSTERSEHKPFMRFRAAHPRDTRYVLREEVLAEDSITVNDKVANGSTREVADIDRLLQDRFLCRTDQELRSCECNANRDYAPGNGYPCPPECSCFVDGEYDFYLIDCTYRNLTTVPPLETSLEMPSATFLSGNFLTSINATLLSPYVRAQELNLNDNHLEFVEDDTFANFTDLRVLDLSLNALSVLAENLFVPLVSLESLILSHNRLRTLSVTVLQTLNNLRVLRLDHNRMTNVSVWSLQDFPSLRDEGVSLDGNPWICDCDYFVRFRDWMRQTHLVEDAEHVSCTGDPANPGRVEFLSEDTRHCAKVTVIIDTEMWSIIVSFTALILSTSVLVYCYRREIQVLLYSRCGVRLFQRTRFQDGGKTYDAFVAYSGEDEQFVAEQLIPGLERIENPYRVCVHHRDFLVGALITENILEAVDKSCRTIVVLSQNFVNSSWCRFEFKTAHNSSLCDRVARLIVVVLGDIPEGCDPEMKQYLKTNTYLQWGDKLFWQKLYFALPDRQKMNGGTAPLV